MTSDNSLMYWETYMQFMHLFIQGASVNWAILQHCFFWFGNTGADAAIAILLSTLKRFICNGDAQRAFAVKAFYKNGDSFMIAQREFQREFVIHRNPIVLFHKGSTPFCASLLCVTRAVWSQCSTDFTQPPFFFSVEPVASKFRTQVLMAWADGTAQLRWIPNSLQNSRWAITKLSPYL